MKKTITLALVLYTSLGFAGSTQFSTKLPKIAYAIKATEILRHGLHLCTPSYYQTFIQEQRKLIYNLPILDIEETARTVDLSIVNVITLNHKDCDPDARFLLSYATAANDLWAHRTRRVLGCRVGSLESF